MSAQAICPMCGKLVEYETSNYQTSSDRALCDDCLALQEEDENAKPRSADA